MRFRMCGTKGLPAERGSIEMLKPPAAEPFHSAPLFTQFSFGWENLTKAPAFLAPENP